MAWYNPHVEDRQWEHLEPQTTEWYAYWEEQVYRCLHGFDPGNGLPFVQGRYYFILNFCKANTKNGWVNPSFRDYQNDFFAFFEKNDAEGVNTGMKKARRKGFTLLGMMGILYYDMLFYDAICDGLAVGDDETLTTLRTFLWDHIGKVDVFFQLNTTTWNKDVMQFGWVDKDGDFEKDMGTGNKLRMELMSKNTEIFKGTIMRHIIFEEIGKFEKLRQAYNDSKDCFMDGSTQVGTGVFGGTGGNVERGSKDFMYMSNKPNLFNLRWQFVTALKGYAPFIDENGNSIIDPPTPEVAKKLARMWQRPYSDCLMGAYKYWITEESKLKNAGDKSELYTFYQNMPVKEEHIFLNKGSGVFNQVLLDEQAQRLDLQDDYEGATRGSLRLIDGWRELYKANGEGWSQNMVEFIPHPEGDCILYKYPNYLGTDLGGLDPYAQEETVTSDSKGVFYVFRMTTTVTPNDNKAIFKYSGRPAVGKDFHHQVFLACVMYDIKVNVEANMGAEFFAYMEGQKAESYLELAPKGYDEFETQAKNKYGTRMSVPVKKIMVSRFAEHITEDCEKLWDPELVNELKYFGSMNTDHVFAYGMCLMSAYKYYSVGGVMNVMEAEEQEESSLVRYKKIDGHIVAIVGK